MHKNFDRNNRRIFNYPAVVPCQDVNPVTLVSSLISLSNAIMTHQHKFFASQRKNARESIRQVSILNMFFVEVMEKNSIAEFPDSVILCFSELHHSLQKILFLLEDVTRNGSRVYILMKSHFVATQFSNLIRSIATTLDILDFKVFDLSREIKELVEMIAKQARKANIQVDPDDEYAMKRVMLILNQFENRFEPDSIMIKRVLYYLRISTWSDCHNEIKFLDDEICSENNNRERDIHLLGTLAGFMRYCRGVLFENNLVEYNENQLVERGNLEILSCLNPEDFRCPISLELMTDPVTVSTGQTYDRVSIQKWLKSGNLICPKTGEKLASTELVPNVNLRKVIQQYCIDHGVPISKFHKQSRDISSTILPGSPAAAEAIKFLSEYLVRRLRNGTVKQKSKAAYEIRLLAKSNIYNRFCLIQAGVIPLLLKLLSSSEATVQENAIAGLLKLSKHPNGKKVIINHDGLKQIVEVLENGLKLEAKQIAAATIFYLSSVQSYQRLIGEIPEAIPALIELIKTGTTCGKKNSLAALFGILLYPRNHEAALSSGIVPLLSSIISTSDKPEIITDSLAVLATLAESFDGSHAILKDSSLALLIKTLQTSPSQAAKEYCVSILLALCNNLGNEVVAVLANNDNLIGFLYTLSTSGGSQAGKKARALIRMMHRYHETSSSNLMANWDSSRAATIHSC